MATNKMTNKTALLYALENLPDAPADVREKWQKMVDQLDRKNASPKKMTAKQEQNEVVKESIVTFLTDNSDKGFTCSDLIHSVPELAEASNQYVSALMRLLIEANRVVKYTEKRRTYFKVA